MGTGIPDFGVYGKSVSGVDTTIIWGLANQTVPRPAGCNFLYLTSTTLGAESYKLFLSVLVTARISNRAVRFYAHADRDGGCGVDFVQLI